MVASSKKFGGAMSQKKLREFYSTIDEIANKEAFLETVRERFKDVKDPRPADNQVNSGTC